MNRFLHLCKYTLLPCRWWIAAVWLYCLLWVVLVGYYSSRNQSLEPRVLAAGSRHRRLETGVKHAIAALGLFSHGPARGMVADQGVLVSHFAAIAEKDFHGPYQAYICRLEQASVQAHLLATGVTLKLAGRPAAKSASTPLAGIPVPRPLPVLPQTAPPTTLVELGDFVSQNSPQLIEPLVATRLDDLLKLAAVSEDRSKIGAALKIGLANLTWDAKWRANRRETSIAEFWKELTYFMNEKHFDCQAELRALWPRLRSGPLETPEYILLIAQVGAIQAVDAYVAEITKTDLPSAVLQPLFPEAPALWLEFPAWYAKNRPNLAWDEAAGKYRRKQ